MAKLAMTVQLKTNAGVAIGSQITSGDQSSKSAAEAAIATVIQQRVDAANGAAQDLIDAQSAFNS